VGVGGDLELLPDAIPGLARVKTKPSTNCVKGAIDFADARALVGESLKVTYTNTMKALGWNCQGMGRSLQSEKMMHLARMIHSTRA
jgi:hypothetical protein